MSRNRVFVSQETLDSWLSNERVTVEGEIMTLLPERQRFRLTTAVHFLKEVAEGGDEPALVGKVKDLDAVTELGGDHVSGSVVIGDNAYEVIEGFLGDPMHEPMDEGHEVAVGGSLAAATAAALGEGPPSGELDLLARFFLKSR